MEIREVLNRLEHSLGFRIKVVERTGSSLKNIFSNTNPWAGAHCGREECVTCNQGDEVKTPCTKRNLVYENICIKCNPEAVKKGELISVNKEVPSIYVGETARSIQERAREHWDSFRSRNSDSHILKHWTLHHDSEGEPEFIMKVVKYHKTALSRQVGEAIRIAKRGIVLNSKSEYNRCSITRLSLQEEDNFKKNEQQEGMKDLEIDWTEKLLEKRDDEDREARKRLGRAATVDSRKRKDAGPEGGRRTKRKKYTVGDEDWGLASDGNKGASQAFLYSGLEGVPKPSGALVSTRKCTPRALEAGAVTNRKITEWTIEWKNYEPWSPIDMSGTVRGGGDSKTPPPQVKICVQESEDTASVIEYGESEKNVDVIDATDTIVDGVNVDVVDTDVESSPVSMLVKKDSEVKEGARKEKDMSRTKTKKKKVWTKLRNGLFGWRVQPLRSAKPRLIAEASCISLPSGGLLKWVPAGDRILTFEEEIETKKFASKRKLSLGGDRGREENETESNGTKRLRWNDILD